MASFGLVLAALIAMPDAGEGSASPRRGPIALASASSTACPAMLVRVRVRRWMWVKKTRRVHGRRVIVRRHGRPVYIRIRITRLKARIENVCPPSPSSSFAPATPASPALASAPAAPSLPSGEVASSGVSHLEYVLTDGLVSVYDLDHEYRLTKTISLPQTIAEVRGVTVAPSMQEMFIPYGGDGGVFGSGSVLAYDLVAERVVWDVKLRSGIDSGQVSPDATKIYVPSGENSSGGTWNVLSTANGQVISTIQGTHGPHNTVASEDGRYVYLGGRASNSLGVYETASGRVREVGPLIGTARPFTVNGSNTLAFTTATNFDGFQVSSIQSGRVLFTVSFGAVPKGFPYSAPSHGASLSPDERQLYVLDSPRKQVQVWDVSRVSQGIPPSQIGAVPVAGLSGVESPCAYDCGRSGWLQLSRDGRLLFVGDSGDVIDTQTRRVIASLPALANTKKSIEVDWQGGMPIATSSRTGVGRLR